MLLLKKPLVIFVFLSLTACVGCSGGIDLSSNAKNNWSDELEELKAEVLNCAYKVDEDRGLTLVEDNFHSTYEETITIQSDTLNPLQLERNMRNMLEYLNCE